MDIPTPADPTRKEYIIEYQVGQLPPGFIYITQKEYSKEKEAMLIKADIKKRMETPGETITI